MSKEELEEELDYHMHRYLFLKKHGIRNELLSKIIDGLQVDIDNYDLTEKRVDFRA